MAGPSEGNDCYVVLEIFSEAETATKGVGVYLASLGPVAEAPVPSRQLQVVVSDLDGQEHTIRLPVVPQELICAEKPNEQQALNRLALVRPQVAKVPCVEPCLAGLEFYPAAKPVAEPSSPVPISLQHDFAATSHARRQTTRTSETATSVSVRRRRLLSYRGFRRVGASR